MEYLVCLEKIRDKHNKIIGYKVEDTKGVVKYISSLQLKMEIAKDRITMANLILTSDNRLVDIKIKNPRDCKNHIIFGRTEMNLIIGSRFYDEPKNLSFRSNVKNLTALLHKAKLSGLKYEKLKEHLYSITNKDSIVIASDLKIVLVNNENSDSTVRKRLFERTMFNHIDFKGVDTSRIKDMSYMFYNSRIESIDFRDFNTSNVLNMCKMFCRCDIEKLDLSNFDTSKVHDMSGMFMECKARYINIDSFNTSNVTNMSEMFYCSRFMKLDLSHFDTTKVKNMEAIFAWSSIKILDVSSFNLKNTENYKHLFYLCTNEDIQVICKDKNIKNEVKRFRDSYLIRG